MAMLAGTHAQAQQRCDADASTSAMQSDRFEDSGDGTVTDRQSKLMWTRCSAGQQWSEGRCSGQARAYTWESAELLVKEVNQRGTHFYNDWRLPRLPELASLVDRRCSNPRVDLVAFPGTPAGTYWSATPRPGTTDRSFVYALDFGSDGMRYLAKEQLSHVRLVRRSQ